MITLDLTNGNVLRMNLENRDNEKPLRDAWYAMSDMPSCKDKVLTVITDKHETHKFKVSDIKNCLHSDLIFKGVTGPEGPKPAVLKEPTKPKTAASPKGVLCDTGNALEIVKNMEHFLEMSLRILKSMPESHKKNMILFIDGIREKDIPLDVSDSAIFEIANMAMRDDEIKVPYYVDLYCAHWKKFHGDFFE
jgi:hypothetical protein